MTTLRIDTWRFLCFALILALVSSCNRPQSASLAIVHVNIIHVDDGRVAPDMTVVIDGERIVAVDSSDVLPAPATAEIVNGSGKYLIPGLWDMHVHLAHRTVFTDAQLSALVARGITGVRDMGSLMEPIRAWRSKLADGLMAPRIVTAGRVLDGPRRSNVPAWRLLVPDGATAAEAVDSVLAEGSDFVKVHDWLASDQYLAIAARSRERGVTVAGHIPIAVGLRGIVEAGQRSVEHLGNIYGGLLLDASSNEEPLRHRLLQLKTESDDAPFEYAFSPEFIAELVETYDADKAASLFAAMAANQVWQVPTLVLYRANAQGRADMEGALSNPKLSAALDLLYRRQLETVGAMREAGVRFMVGTDNWFASDPIVDDTVHDEMRLLVEAGFSTAEALRAATLNPAVFLGTETSMGAIEPGKLADLVLLDGNPLEDIARTEAIQAVVRSGQLISRDEIEELLEAARVAATN